MKNKKGFTLVELIAIIIIIGIIIGIITPTAIKLIEKSKANSFREGLRSIIRSAEIYMEENDLKTLPEEGIYLQDNDLDIDYAEGYSGIIKYVDGEIVLQNVGNGTYCGGGSKDTLSVSDFTEDCIVVKPAPQCFLMGTTDTTGDTIVGYDYGKAECSSMELSIPATVNKVPVKYIADGAFLDSYEYVLGVGYYDTSSIGGPGTMPVVELLDNLAYMGVTPFATIYMNTLPQVPKFCISTSMEEVPVPVDYMMSSGGYVFCSLSMFGDLSSYQAQGIGITKVDFSNATNLVKIGNSAFSKNFITGAVDLSGATNLTEIAANAFVYNQIESLILPSSLVKIGEFAFADNQMQTITIPSSVTTIGDYAFEENNWSSVTIETNLTNKEDRFNGNWLAIGWPSGLMPEESLTDPVNYVLTTSTNTFPCIKSYYIVDVQTSGNYKLEVWGAQGNNNGGNGGYSTGSVYLNSGTKLYIYAGAQSGYNGGGGRNSATSGGGASDIRVNSTSLFARVIVAGGGGAGSDDGSPGYGGGITGGSTEYANGGTATAGGTGYDDVGNGDFGIGGWSESRQGAGGGGWYGGGADEEGYSGAGGSGYVYDSTTAINYPVGGLLDSSYYLTGALTIDGSSAVSTYDGASTMMGNTGNGYAKITYIG